MNYAAILAAATTDHGRRVLSFAGVPVVDLRGELPSEVVGTNTMGARDASRVDTLGIHHDAVYFPSPASPADPWHTELDRINAVHRYHVANGWGGIGYHLYAFPSGRIYYVGDLDTQRANIAKLNHRSVGIVTAGDFTDAPPHVGAQLAVALACIATWAHFGRLIGIKSHHDAALASDPTECCGATRDSWVPRLPEAIRAIAPQLRR